MTDEAEGRTREGHLLRLDGVRAIAIILVLLVHCVVAPAEGFLAWALRHTLSNGWIGVDLFFVLSGFLITTILLRSRSDPGYFRNFYARRFLRILPPYYLLLFLMLFFAPGLGLPEFEPSWPYFAYVNNWTYVFGVPGFKPMSHSWSLAIEEQYYLLFPLAVWFMRTHSLKRLLWAAVLLSPLIRLAAVLLEIRGATYFLTICRLDVLAMGGLIAVFFHERGAMSASSEERRRLVAAFVVAVGAVTVFWLTKSLDFRQLWFNVVGLTLVDGTCALFLCLALLFRGGPLEAVLSSPAMVAMGRWSYGIYLFHFPVLQIIDPHVVSIFGATWARTLVTGFSTISVTVLLAALSWRYFESPILGLKRYFSSAQPPNRDATVHATS